jgi:UDP-glucose 4-epimerase
MRVAVVGATGNVGSALLRALLADSRVEEIIGIARRAPRQQRERVHWVAADITRSELAPLFAGVDAVVHLAWLIQPSRNETETSQTNLLGSQRVFDAVAAAGVPTLVYASSLAAYGPGPKSPPVSESWGTAGIPSSYYSRQKAGVERRLDRFEREHPEVRTVRLRPALIMQRSAASEIRRLFAGPLLPSPLVRRSLIPLVPDIPGLVAQVLHSDDVADAYRRAVVMPAARGAYNVAADPPLDAQTVAPLLGARTVRVSSRVARAAVTASWKLRLQPTSPGWLDLGRAAPILSTAKARRELGWSPAHTPASIVGELLEGLRDAAGDDLPPLEPHAGGPLRIREFLTGVGGAPR